MLTKYLEAAMRHAHWEILKEDGTYYGEIPECRGVYANAPTIDECRSKLREVLEDWILFRVYMHLELPTIDGLELTVKKTVNRENVPTPPVLYKYYACNKWTQDIFERNQIYFQSPDGFNDPLDSKVSTAYEGTEEQRVSRVIDLWRKGPAKEKKEEDLRPQALDIVRRDQDITRMLKTSEQSEERTRKQMGIFCMSSKRDNILMWSHYAEAHKGFCLGFRTGSPFFGRALPVENYASDRPCLNLVEPPPLKETTQPLLTKAKDWEYEDEWRIVDYEGGPGVKQYPAEALRSVILGCRIMPGNRQQIMQWWRARNPRPDVYWAQEKEKEFGLDIIPVPWVP